MKMKTIALFLPFMALLAGAPARAEEPPAFKQDTLTIETARGTVRFTVEIAHTPAQQEYGLMFRKTIPRTHGMLFLWPHDTNAAMWMKNTLMPLDILFIDAQGRIVYVARRAKPESTDIISAGRPVRAVLELYGGTAQKQGIAAGDRVHYSAFAP